MDQSTVSSSNEAICAAPISTASVFNAPQSAQLLIDLEAQQDHLLRELDELNMRIEQAIVAGQMHVRRPSEANAAA